MSGTNQDEQSLSTELTADEMFSQIQSSLREGSDIDNLMKAELIDEVKETAVSTIAPEAVTPSANAPVEVVTQPVVVDPTQADAWLATLPADVQEKVLTLKQDRDAARHKIKSDEGRVPNLQRKVEEMERKLRQRPEPQAASVTSPAAAGGKLSERLAQIKDVDPVLYETLEALRDEVTQPLRNELQAKTESIKNEINEEKEKVLFDTQWNKLISVVPRAPEVFKLPAYRQWVNDQSEGMQNLAGSIYADDVLVVLEKFARETQARSAPPQAQPVEATTQTKPTPVPATDDRAAKIEAERQRKLRGAAPATVSGVAKAGEALPDDPEALFHYYAEKIRKQEM